MIRWIILGVFVFLLIISVVVTSGSIFDDGVITYFVEPSSLVPITEKNMDNAISKAFTEWTELNPELIFVQVYSSSESEITIHWANKIYFDKIAVMGTTETNGGSNIITVDYGGFDCNNNIIFYTPDTIKDTIKHEIGHVLGLGHSTKIDHLMYDPLDGIDDFDNLGYVIPNTMENDYFVGQEELFDEYELIPYRTDRTDQLEKNLNCFPGQKI
jgi:hypothetical protein